MSSLFYSVGESLEMIKSKRPEIDPNIGFIGQLQMLEEEKSKSSQMYF